MNDFFKWVFHHNTPDYVVVMFTIALVSLAVTVLIISIVAVVTGYWVVPVILLILLPAYAVIRAYLEDNDD